MSRNDVKKDLITPTLAALINDLKGGRSTVIQGSLQVKSGHSYWWFLEYGTGDWFQGDDGELTAPTDVRGETASGGPYEITVKDAKLLVYMARGRYYREETTEHPGIKPVSFVRTSIYEALKDFETTLQTRLKRSGRTKKGRWAGLPKRDELVEIVNDTLEILLDTVQFRTPDNTDPDPFHEDRNPIPLSEAWLIKKAK